MDEETEKLVHECETSWETRTITIPNVVLDDAPLKDLMVKAHNILAGESHESLDAIVCRLADAIPEGVTEENFQTAKPLSKVCKNWFGQVEKLRAGLKRPALDWGKAVDTAAKEWVARAAPTLNPIIDKVKAIEDRKKAEKAAAEAAEQKRLVDEANARIKEEQDAERARIKAEQDVERERVAAERKRLAEIAEANRIEAEKLAAERKEMDDLKRWLAEREKVVVSKGSSDYSFMDEIGGTWVPPPPVEVPTVYDADGDPVKSKFTNSELQSIMHDAETSAEYSKAGVEVDSSADQQKVRDYGMAIKTFVDSLKRPLLVKHEARQAVELAVFDIYGVANSLQEWRMP